MTPIWQNVLYWPPWVLGLILAVVLPLLVALVSFLVVRRRKKAKGKAGALSLDGVKGMPEAGSPAAKPSLSRGSLVRVWREFLGRMPWEIRRYVGDFQPFVVMGEAGCGKSSLISACTDWEGQSLQFHPSHVTSPLIQFYMGSRVLVLELSSSVLTDTTVQAQRAIESLWKAFPRHKVPHVVLALNGASLAEDDPESVRRLARYMRGKINLMARAVGKSVHVSLALTHMDQVEGYSQWAAFLEKRGLPLHAVWNAEGPLPSLETALDAYEALLPRALTSLPTRDYLAMVSFLKDAHGWLSVLEHFTRVLQAPDSFSPSPGVARLTLHGSGQGVALADPFQATEAPLTRRPWPPIRKHQLAAGGILLAGLVFFGGLFLVQHDDLVKLDHEVEAVEVVRPPRYEDVHALFPKVKDRFLFSRLTPDFFPEREQIIVQRLTEAIRRHYLYPTLHRLRSLPDSNEPIVYLLGLMYASPQNGLGSLVLSQPHDFATPLNLPPQLVVDYATYNLKRPDITMDLSVFRLMHPSSWDPSENTIQWGFLFRRLETVRAESFMTPDTLKELQATANPILKMVQRVFAFPLLDDIVENLKHIAPFGADIEWVQRRDVFVRQQQLLDFLKAIVLSSLEIPDIRGLSLGPFLELVHSMPMRPVADQEPLTLNLSGRSFIISIKEWEDLVMRSQMTLMMRRFIAQNQQSRGFIFFEGSAEFPDIWLNPSNDGTLFFGGRAQIDGRFSRSAYEKRVKPVVGSLEENLKDLPVSRAEKDRFTQFVTRQLESYADRYVNSYRHYYSQFHIRADSEGALRFVLNQIPALSSPFLDFLVTLHTNTSLDTGDNPMLAPLSRRLDTFSFVRTLMQEKDGAYPEWEKYKGLIQQMKDELDGEATAQAGAKGNETAAFKALLTPLGRIGFAIQMNEPDSYLALARQWVRSVGIDAEWQAPFLEPFQLAFFLGKTGIETSTARIWSDLVREYIDPLRDKFPFDPRAEREVSPQDLERTLNPQGNFWKSFRMYLAPVCEEVAGVWGERITPLGVIALPDGMLETVNEVTRVSNILWDEKGAPKALTFSIKPHALPAAQDRVNIPVLCYLRMGQATVFAFNQQPTWQDLTVEWWKADSAAVGMAFESPHSRKRSHRELLVDRRHWALHRLLVRGLNVNPTTVAWSLDSPWGGAPLSMEFLFKSDPWALFRLWGKTSAWPARHAEDDSDSDPWAVLGLPDRGWSTTEKDQP